MAFIADDVFDNGLGRLNLNVDQLYICSQEPTTLTEATTTYALGNKASPTVGTPVDGASSGRRVIVSAISDGSVTATGTASHWALVDAGTLLYATGSLSSSQAVTNGNTFTLTQFDVTIPDAA